MQLMRSYRLVNEILRPVFKLDIENELHRRRGGHLRAWVSPVEERLRCGGSLR